MKKLLEKANEQIPGELKQSGLRFNWYVGRRKLYSISVPSLTAAWWFLKGILLMKKICPLYRKEMNRLTGR